jgi:hypothetical protein
LTVRAQRRAAVPEDAAYLVAERPVGSYARQLVVGDGLSLDAIVADYHDGVLTLTIPVAEQAKPRRIDVGRCQDSDTALSGGGHKTISGQAAQGDQPVGAATTWTEPAPSDQDVADTHYLDVPRVKGSSCPDKSPQKANAKKQGKTLKEPHGTTLLLLVAAGLARFWVYCLFDARYRRG